jgi:hypothetical protein
VGVRVFAPRGDVDDGGVSLLVMPATFLWLILLLVGADMLTSRHDKRSAEQIPRAT